MQYSKKYHGSIPGHALCTAQLVDVIPFTSKHLDAACMHKDDVPKNAFAWILSDIKAIRPIPLKGKLGLWNYDGEIEYLNTDVSDEEDEKMYHEIWEPLFV